MKKIFISLLLLAPIAVFADDFGINVPEWKDFAPSAFVDIKEPKGFGKLNVNASYWYRRKVDFDSAIEECKAKESNDERFNCYEIVKIKQFKENSDYNARIEARERLNSGIPEMNDKTDVMFPINGYLNNFGKFQANEIR